MTEPRCPQSNPNFWGQKYIFSVNFPRLFGSLTMNPELPLAPAENFPVVCAMRSVLNCFSSIVQSFNCFSSYGSFSRSYILWVPNVCKMISLPEHGIFSTFVIYLVYPKPRFIPIFSGYGVVRINEVWLYCNFNILTQRFVYTNIEDV